jgi:hypothetical protein
MKTYVHARLTNEDRVMLEDLRKMTGSSESELIRSSLRLAFQELGRKRSALELAGSSVGKFKKGLRDLAAEKKHLEGFGK